jgi:hypothetical protein
MTASLSRATRYLSVLSAFAIAVTGATVLSAQQSQPGRGKAYSVPRTPDGHPDFQGVWANNMATPLERPKELAGKPLLTDAELEDFKQRAAQLFDGGGDTAFGDALYQAVLSYKPPDPAKGGSYKKAGTGDYNTFWLVDRELEHRTSLVFDPPDGRLPALTPEAQKRQAAAADARRRQFPEGPEDMSLGVRCLTYGVPRIGGLNAGYNSYYEFVQSKDFVAINNEMIHETRLPPLDGRPHLPSAVRQWQGDSRARWEGDTLVVDTKNFSKKIAFMQAGENLHIVEKFTRVADDMLHYEVTVTDPDTWTRPWSALIKLRRAKPGEYIYETACHEGNSSMVGILGGARAQEREAAGTGSPK